MPGQVQGIRRNRASLRPSPSFAKSGSLRPKRQQTNVAGERSTHDKLTNALKNLATKKEKQNDVLTIESFIERSRNNEIV